jgi:hypothetical protein
MDESITIPRNLTPVPAEDYYWLKQEGIRHIEKLAHRLWTDYNLQDPGITILELLCYSLADLGYRCSYPLPDLLAPDPMAPPEAGKSFHTAREILPCNALTVNDFRKLFIDIAGVRNAWLQFRQNDGPVVCEGEPGIYLDCKEEKLSLEALKRDRLYLNGLLRLEVLFEEDVNADPDRKKEVKAEVWKRAQAHRNLAEDFCREIKEIGYEDIGLCLEIEVTPQANVHEVLARIWYQLEEFLNPQLHFYTLEEMLNKGVPVESIFEGPVLDHGFMDDDEIAASQRKSRIYASDLYNIIMDIEGVRHIRRLELTNYDEQGNVVSAGNKWQLDLADWDCKVPRIDPERSPVVFYKGELPFVADPVKVEARRTDLEISGRARRPGKKAYDLPVPEGRFRDPARYHAFTQDLPEFYGVSNAGLPGNSSDERIAQARQLKGYLLFFEQILANYFSQLAGLRHLFRWSEADGNTDFPTYFYQALSNDEIQEVEDLYFNPGNMGTRLGELVEDENDRLERRNRFLDHLMARFSEQMAEYSLILSSLGGSGAQEKLLTDKARFLRDYPQLSHDRGKGSDMLGPDIWDTDNVSGLVQRAGRLLGIEDIRRRNLSGFNFSIDEDTNTGKWTFTLNISLDAPNGPTTVLPFVSIEFDTPADAETGLERALRNASFSADWISGTLTGGQYTLHIDHDDPAVPIATMAAQAIPGFAGLDAVRNALQAQIAAQETANEGLFVFEHLLLRPRELSWTDDDILLRACVRCSPQSDATTDGGDSGCISIEAFPRENAGVYGFFFESDQSESILENPVAGYPSEVDRDNALFSVYEAGQDGGNFQIIQDGPNGEYRFELRDNGGTLLAISRPTANYDVDEVSALVQRLVRYFQALANPGQGIPVEIGVQGDACQYENDPYSFRIAVVLPGWTERFSDPNFRQFAERVIREETPAHIHARICWISRRQMKELETCYATWLQANADFLTPGGGSNAGVSAPLQDLVSKLAGLKNYYPARSVLHDCAGPGNDSAIILDNSILGNS